jgi:hypothetical protein
VRFDVRYPGGSESEPWFLIQVVRPTDRIELRVKFDVAELPGRVWRIDGLIPEAHAGDPEQSEPLEPDEFGCVEAEFVRPPQGLTYGVAWQW